MRHGRERQVVWAVVSLMAGCGREPSGTSSATSAPPPVTASGSAAPPPGASASSLRVSASGAASASTAVSASARAEAPRLVLTSEPTGAVVYRDDPTRPPLCTTPCDVALADAAPGQAIKLIFTIVNRRVVFQTLTLKAGVNTLAVTVPAMGGK